MRARRLLKATGRALFDQATRFPWNSARRAALLWLASAALALASVQAHAQFLPGRAPGFRPGFQFIGGAGGFPTPGAIVDYDFKGDRYSGPQISVSRASPAYIDDSAGNWTLVPANTLRRSDKGALIEGTQTNYIANSAMLGAAVGNPGSTPNGWVGSLSAAGITQQVTGVPSQRGMDCIDLRVSGTATASVASVLYFGPSINQVSSAPGQIHTLSAFSALIAGSFGNATLDLAIRENDSSNAFLRQTLGSLLGSNGTLQRYSVSTTTGASTAGIATGLRLGAISGTVVDFTLRQCWPQGEVWSAAVTTVGGASSPIRTTGTAATRAADLPSFALNMSGVAGTVAAVVRPGPFVASGGLFASLLNSAGSPIVQLRSRGAPNQGTLAATADNSTYAIGSNASAVQPSTRLATAFAWSSGDGQIAANGSIDGGTNTSSAPTSAPLTSGTFGSVTTGTPLFGYIERLAIWPYRAANSNLQTYSTLQNWGG